MADYLLHISGDEKLSSGYLRPTEHVLALTCESVAGRYEKPCAAVWLLTLEPDQHEGLAEQMRVIWEGNAEVTLRAVGAAETLVSARATSDAPA